VVKDCFEDGVSTSIRNSAQSSRSDCPVPASSYKAPSEDTAKYRSARHEFAPPWGYRRPSTRARR